MLTKNFYNIVFSGDSESTAATNNKKRFNAVDLSFLTQNANFKRLKNIVDRTGIGHESRFRVDNKLADLEVSASGWIPNFDSIVNPGEIKEVSIFGDLSTNHFDEPAFDMSPFDPNNLVVEEFLPFSFNAKFVNRYKMHTLLKNYKFSAENPNFQVSSIIPDNHNRIYDFGNVGARGILEVVATASDLRGVAANYFDLFIYVSGASQAWTRLGDANSGLRFTIPRTDALQGKPAYAYNRIEFPAGNYRRVRAQLNVVPGAVNNITSGIVNCAFRLKPAA